MANYELGSLVWRVKGDTADFDKSIGGSQTRFEKFSASARKIGANLTKFVTLPLVGIGAVAVKAASDLGESLNAVSVVFGDAAGTITDFGETASEAAGLSQNSFNELATVIGAQLKQSGLSIDTVADQTVELTQRSADLASVFNVDVKEATTALGAALRGESEPARRFGVNISDAAVQAEALASGLVETKDQITEQIKVQARYNLILRQSEQVAGDFSNTSDSLANQTRILRANLENVGAELGQAFIPLVTDAVSAVGDIVRGFADLDDGTKKLIIALGVIAAASGPVIGAIGALAKLKAAIVAINTTALFGPVGIIVGIAAITAGLIGLGRARRQSQLEEIAEEFAGVQSAAGLAVEEIEAIEQALRLGSMDNFGDAAEQVDALSKNLGVSKTAVIDIGLASENVTQRYREQLQTLRDQITEQVTLNSYQDAWIVNANERAAADARAAEILRQRAEDAEREAEEQARINGLAVIARAEAERKYGLLLQEEQAQNRIQEIEIERQLALDELAANYVRTGKAVDDLNEYYDTLISKEQELQAERDAADQAARLEEELQEQRENAAEEAKIAQRLTALRLELFGTEEEQFKARLEEQLALYEEYGLQRRELDEFAASEWQRYNDSRLGITNDAAEKEAQVAERLTALRLELFGTEEEQFRAQLEEQLALYEDYGLSQRELDEFAASEWQRYNDNRLGIAKDAIQAEKEEAQSFLEWYEDEYVGRVLGAASGLYSSLARFASARADAEIAAIERSTDSEEEKAEKIRAIKIRQARADKAAGIFKATVDTANAIVGFLADPGGVAGIILSVIAGITGAAQIGAIAAQPIPQFAMGGNFVTNGPQQILVGDNPGGRERVNIEPLGSEGGGSPMQLLVMLDGREIANSTVDYINNGVVRVEARV